jgi:hypothetical protein
VPKLTASSAFFPPAPEGVAEAEHAEKNNEKISTEAKRFLIKILLKILKFRERAKSAKKRPQKPCERIIRKNLAFQPWASAGVARRKLAARNGRYSGLSLKKRITVTALRGIFARFP